MTAVAPATVPLADLTRLGALIGCLGFGGPAGQIALLRKTFVEERGWVDEAAFVHALNICMFLPGPEAQQLATYLGWLKRGVLGGLIVGGLFVLPGAALLIALSWLYAVHAEAAGLDAAFLGVKAAVVALLVEAMIKLSRRALTSRLAWAIAVGAFVALFGLNLPFPVIVAAAGALGALALRRRGETGERGPSPAAQARPGWRAGGTALAAWLAPVAACALLLGGDHVLTKIGMLFSGLSLVTFGGAYATLAYVQQQAVEAQGWLTAAQMLDGLGLAETTPGPLVLVNQHVGFLAGWGATGGGPGLALAGAAMASWCTFAPSFVWIFALAPHAERLRRSPWAAGLLAGVSAAALGVIAAVGADFAARVLFARQIDLAGWLLPDPTSLSPLAALIALGAGAALIRFKWNVALVVLAAALAGWAAGGLG